MKFGLVKKVLLGCVLGCVCLVGFSSVTEAKAVECVRMTGNRQPVYDFWGNLIGYDGGASYRGSRYFDDSFKQEVYNSERTSTVLDKWGRFTITLETYNGHAYFETDKPMHAGGISFNDGTFLKNPPMWASGYNGFMQIFSDKAVDTLKVNSIDDYLK